MYQYIAIVALETKLLLTLHCIVISPAGALVVITLRVLRAHAQKSPFFPILLSLFWRKVSKTTFLATIFKIVPF